MNLKLKIWLGIATLLFTASSQAAVNVSFERDIELLAINGEQLGLLSSASSEIELENGPNQLIARVSKLVSYHGEFKKFLSKPVVLTFNVSDTDVHVRASRVIIRDDQIKGFDKNPSLALEMRGKPFTEFHQGILPRGAGLVRDYERELAAYNVEHGFAAEAKPRPSINYVVTVAADSTKQKNAVATVSKSPLSTDNVLILLQADYLRLPADKRAAFLDWAQQQ